MAKSPCLHIDKRTGKVYTEDQFKAMLANDLPELLEKLPEFKPKYEAVAAKVEELGGTSVIIAPFYDKQAPTREAADKLVNSPAVQQHLENMRNLAKAMGIGVKSIKSNLGKFTNSAGTEVYELSHTIQLDTKDLDKATTFAAIMGVMGPEAQQSTISGRVLSEAEMDTDAHTADRMDFQLNSEADFDNAVAVAKASGLDYSANVENKTIFFLDFSRGQDSEYWEKVNTFDGELKKNGITGQLERTPIESRLIQATPKPIWEGGPNSLGRDGILQAEQRKVEHEGGGAVLRHALDEAVTRNNDFLKQQELEPVRKEYAGLRQKEIELGQKGERLTDEEVKKKDELYKKLLPEVKTTVAKAADAYGEAKEEIEKVGAKVVGKKGFVVPFNIKKAERAAVKVLRWYQGKAQWLGDGARTTIVVHDGADIHDVVEELKKQYGGGIERNETDGPTELGYPKQLLEVRTKNGRVAEFQVMTPEGYLAKDGITNFQPEKQGFAKQVLDKIRDRLGFDIPDGAGHYLYEISRDFNVPDELRKEADRLSRQYYDGMTNENSKLDGKQFEKDMKAFVDKVDGADKSGWDEGNKGVAPEPVREFIGAEEADKNLPTYTEKNVESIDTNGREGAQKKVLEDAKRVIKAISGIVKKGTGLDLKVVIHDDPESFSRAVRRAGGDSQNAGARGFYMGPDGAIHLNMDNVKEDTMLHEGFHPLLDYIADNNPEALDKLYGQLKDVPGAENIVAKADKDYTGEITQKKEAITDFIAKVANGDIKIEPTTIDKIKDFINKALNVVGLGKAPVDMGLDMSNAEDLKALAKLISDKFQKGEKIEVDELADYKELAEKPESSHSAPINVNIKNTSENGPEFQRVAVAKEEDEKSWVKKRIISVSDALKGKKISNAIFYDNTRVGKLEIKNRLSGYTPDVEGHGGFGWSYMPGVEKSGFVIAVTEEPGNAIAAVKRQILHPDGIQVIVNQNNMTSHLGNLTTLEALFGKGKGIFQESVGSPKEEKQVLNIIKKAMKELASKNGKSALEIQKLLKKADLSKVSSLDELNEKFLQPASFGQRNILFSDLLQKKATKVTAGTREAHRILHYEYGIPTLTELAEGNNEKAFSNAELGDVVKYIKPSTEKVLYTANGDIYKKLSNDAEVKNAGFKVEMAPEESSHPSYPVMVKGENIGIGDKYISGTDLFPEVKEKGTKKSQSFYGVGRRKGDAPAGSFPENAEPQGKPQFQKDTSKEEDDKNLPSVSKMILDGKTDEEITAEIKRRKELGFTAARFPERVIGARKADIEKDLEELGLSPLEKAEVKANKMVWDKAVKEVNSGKVQPLDIADKINSSSDATITTEEKAALLYERGKLLNAHDEAVGKMNKAIDSGDDSGVLSSLEDMARITDQYNQVATAAVKGTSEAARVLQLGTRDTSANYHLLEVKRRLNEFVPADAKTQKKVEGLVAKLKEATDRLEQSRQKEADLQRGQAIQDEINKQLKEQVKLGGGRLRGDALIADATEDFAKLFGLIDTGPQFQKAEDEKNVSFSNAVAKLAKGFADKGLKGDAIWDKVKEHVKEKTGRDIPEIYKDDALIEAKDTGEAIKEKVAEKVQSGDTSLKDMKGELKKRQRELVADGMKKHQEVTETITKELNDAAGEDKFDERAVRDVLSGYGETTKPSSEQLEKDIRDQNVKMRLASSKEDVIIGQAPLKSGFQREAPTQEIRELQREVQRIMKDKGIQDGRSPEQRWKTSLEAIKTGLKRQIEDLTKQLNTGVKEQKNKAKTPYDNEAKNLLAFRNQLLADVERIFGKTELTDEQKVKMAMESAEKSLKEYERKIDESDYSVNKSSTPVTPELKKMRDARDAKRKEYEQKKKAATGKAPKSEEQKAFDRAQKEMDALDKQIADAEQKIADAQPEDAITLDKQKTSEPVSDRVKAAREENKKRKEWLEQLKNDADPFREEKKALDIWRKRKQAEIEKKKERLDLINKGIEPNPPKPKIEPRSAADIALQAESERLKIQIDRAIEKQRLKARPDLEKKLAIAFRIKRATILARASVFVKLSCAAMWQAGVITPTLKTVQTGIGKIPGLRDVSSNAPTQGNYSLAAAAANYKQFWGKEVYDDIKNTLKTGIMDIDAIDGKQPQIEEHWEDGIGNSHAAVKVIPARAEYFSSAQSVAEWAVRNKLRLDSPHTQEIIHELSYDNAQRNIFKNPNAISKAYKEFINQVADRGGPIGKIAKTMLFDENLPIITVPTNIAIDGATYAFGAARALADAYELRALGGSKGVEGETKENTIKRLKLNDDIMRSLGKQTVGLLGLAIGYSLYHSLGGMYNKGEKKKIDDLKPGEIAVGNWKISPLFTHHPGFYSLQISANFQRLLEAHKSDKTKAGKEPFDWSDALAKSVLATAKEIPFVESMDAPEKVLASGQGVVMAAGQTYLADNIPGFLEEIAKATDPEANRYPQSVWQEIEKKIPILRENVPSEKPGAQRGDPLNKAIKQEKELVKEKEGKGEDSSKEEQTLQELQGKKEKQVQEQAKEVSKNFKSMSKGKAKASLNKMVKDKDISGAVRDEVFKELEIDK